METESAAWITSSHIRLNSLLCNKLLVCPRQLSYRGSPSWWMHTMCLVFDKCNQLTIATNGTRLGVALISTNTRPLYNKLLCVLNRWVILLVINCFGVWYNLYLAIRGLYHPRLGLGWYSPLIARYKLYHTPKQLITNLSHDCPSTSA